MSAQVYTSAWIAQISLTNLLAGVREFPTQEMGIVSGPGNQGSANTAQLMGQSGTPGTFIGVARSLRGSGIGGSTPT